MDSSPCEHIELLVIRSISSEDNDNTQSSFGSTFKNWTDIKIMQAAWWLRSHESYDYAINHQEAYHPSWGPLYPLCECVFDVVRNWLPNMIATGKIWKSTSVIAGPISLVPKANSGVFRLNVNDWGINKIVIAKILSTSIDL
jgi:hypothetical protein